MTSLPTDDTRHAGGPWQRFRRRHLHDYPPAAARLWLGMVVTGAGALGWALWRIAALSGGEIVQIAIGGGLVAVASMFALKIPRTAYSVTVSDIFVFTILALLGTPAAVVGAGIDAAVGTVRTSKRLSSRLSSPFAAMAAMAAAGGVFELLRRGFALTPVGPEAGVVPALCLVAPLVFALTALPAMALMALKRGAPLRPWHWLSLSTWMIAVALAAAFVAGLMYLNVQRFGLFLAAAAAAVSLALVMLLRATIARREAEQKEHDARVAGAEADARLNHERFTAAFAHAAIGMAIVRDDGTMLKVNPALEELLGRGADALVGRPFDDCLHAGDAELFRRRAAADTSFSMELRCRDGGNGDRWVALHCSQYEDPGDFGRCRIYQLYDITSRRQAENRLQHIAYHDGLTDLANRSCFHERLAVAVEKSRTDAAARFAVLFLDLDRFKVVNDSLGHIAGNALLREVAQRLVVCVRPADLVARLGGDEFAILVDALVDDADALRLADRVLAELLRPISINGTEVLAGASVGITFSDLGYRTVDEVLRDADLAMYEAKAAGRGRVVRFDVSMHERVAEKLALESDLRRAIGDGQLSVRFQPLYELQPYRLYGFEALARWEHPTRGPISPAVFITLAEESGHIEALTDWMVEQSVAQLAAWRRELPAADALGVHVNISGRDLARRELPDAVAALLERHDLPPEALTLEITETTLMDRLDVALATLHRLRATGVRFSIDDFGTGYSSLAYHSTLPIDSLKIDRSFVMALQEQPQNLEIVRAVIDLGRSLGRRVIAEGIETPAQLAALRDLGVQIGQGYLLARPLRSDEVTTLLETPLGVPA